MTDLEQRIRQLLDDDAVGAPRVERAPEGIRRRVRGRQARTAAISALSIVALVVVTATVPRLPSFRQPLRGDVGPHTSTVQGVTITYPSDRTLVALDQTTSDWADQQPHAAFRPVFQLTNFDPVDEAAGRQWVCPIDLSGRFPDGGILLYVEAIGGPIVEGAAPWPVPFPTTGGNVPSGGGCAGADTSLDTSWTAGGVTYHGVVMGDPDASIRDAFASMRFADGTPAVPGNVDAGPIEGDAYVIASGQADRGPWNLLAQHERGPSLGLETDGMPVAWQSDPWASLTPFMPVATYFGNEGTGSIEAFGPVAGSVERLEVWLDDGRTEQVAIDDLPASFGGLRAFEVRMPADVGSTLAAYGADDALLATTPLVGVSPDAAIRSSGIASDTLGNGWTSWVTAAPRGTALQVRLWAHGTDDPVAADEVASASGIHDPSDLVILSSDPFAPGNDAFTTTVVVAPRRKSP